MKTKRLVSFALAVGGLLLANQAGATAYKYITIPDNWPAPVGGKDTVGGVAGETWGVAGHNLGPVGEDNEVEPPANIGQEWDLEAMVLGGGKLWIIGGYNFFSPPETFARGDIFLATSTTFNKYGVNTPAVPVGSLPGPRGDEKIVSNSLFGYEYAIRIDSQTTASWASLSTATDLSTFYKVTNPADPWKVNSGATFTSLGAGSAEFGSGDSAAVKAKFGVDVYGGPKVNGGVFSDQHYWIGVDMSWYGNQAFFAHFTYECGNDTIVGLVPDGGLTVTLLGLGLAGLGLAARKMRKV